MIPLPKDPAQRWHMLGTLLLLGAILLTVGMLVGSALEH